MFAAAAAAMLAALAAVQVTAALEESATFDEGPYISAGYSYLKTGDFRINAEHPPLAKILNALPLQWLDPALPQWEKAGLIEFSKAFLYQNRVPADTMLMAARCVTIALTMLLGLAVALVAKSYFGAGAGLLALFLIASDPNIAAHGRYATNDLPVSLFFFLAVAGFGHYVERRRLRDLGWCAAALGLALSTKSSAVILFGVFTVLYLMRAWQEEGEGGLSLDRYFGSMLVLAFVAGLMIWAAYGFQTRVEGLTLEQAADPKTETGHFLGVLARAFHLPDHPYLVGVFMQYMHNSMGHAAYLLGQQSLWGWWYYYPVVFLVKTPTAMLLLTCFGVAAGAIRLRRGRWREIPFRWVVLAVPMAMYGAAAVSSHIDLGVRFLLPVFPFLAVALAGAVFRAGRAAPYLFAAVVIVQTAESAAIYPHHLAFFNALSGGAANGARYLVDSNLDWGQDLKRLKKYVGDERVCLAYFGTAAPEYYGIRAVPLPAAGKTEGMDCLAAASVTLLKGVYAAQGSYGWLREKKPVATIGHSIAVYDLRKRAAK